jgi:hypothetical protein
MVKRRAMAASWLPVLVLASILAGCGSSATSLQTSTIEAAITKSILVQHGAHTTVTCPASVPKRIGEAFTCNAVLEAGDYPVAVTETDAAGHVKWISKAPLVLLDARNVGLAISRSVLSQRGVRATVSCPAEVLQEKGLTFSCRVTVAHSSGKVKAGVYRFQVTEADARGHVRYVGV